VSTQLSEASYLRARGISFAVLGEGPYPEMAPFREFMGYTHPWFSTYGIDDPAYAGGGVIACYLRRWRQGGRPVPQGTRPGAGPVGAPPEHHCH
jgi:hypothetical protein